MRELHSAHRAQAPKLGQEETAIWALKNPVWQFHKQEVAPSTPHEWKIKGKRREKNTFIS